MALKSNEVWMLTQVVKELGGHPKYKSLLQLADLELAKHDKAAEEEVAAAAKEAKAKAKADEAKAAVEAKQAEEKTTYGKKDEPSYEKRKI